MQKDIAVLYKFSVCMIYNAHSARNYLLKESFINSYSWRGYAREQW